MDSSVTPVDGAGQTMPVTVLQQEHAQPLSAAAPVGGGPAAALELAGSRVGEERDRVEAAYAEYVVDPASGQVQIQIRDAQSNEIVRQIPSEESTHAAQVIQAYLNAGRTRRTPSQQEG